MSTTPFPGELSLSTGEFTFSRGVSAPPLPSLQMGRPGQEEPIGTAGQVAARTRLRLPSQRPLFPGCPALFVQMKGTLTEMHAVAGLVREEGMGAVITVAVKDKKKRLAELAAAHRDLAGSCENVMFDANRYFGDSRVIGPADLDHSWIQAQWSTGCRYALTDSPYIGSGNLKALESVLSQTAAFGGRVVAALPLHIDWLLGDADRLIAAINASGVPVALIIEHRRDPFALPKAVLGLLKVLAQVKVNVSLLRCDLSAIGAVAFGASVGAIGTTTSLRHLFPIVAKDTKRRGGGAQIAAYVPSCMTYRTLEKIFDAINADFAHQERWKCTCRYCDGELLSGIVDDVRAYQHSLASIAVMAEDLLTGSSSPAAMGKSWVEKCRHAQFVNLEIEADTGIHWETPKFLGAWHQALPQDPPT